MRRAGFILLVLLCLAISAYALVGYGLQPLGALVHPDMRRSFEAHRVGIYLHIFGALFALALGPVQFMRSLRNSRPGLHRWTGRLYLGVGVLLGGGAGLAMAFFAFGGVVARLGFGLLAVCWLWSGARAYATVRRGDIDAHEMWMTRNFALTLAAVTLRLWLPTLLATGVPFETAYPLVAWLCWVPNLALAEAFFVNRGTGAPDRAAMA